MKYGCMILLLLVMMPSCCLRKKKNIEQPMLIEEESIMPMPEESPTDFTDMDTPDMATMQDEMTQGSTE